MQQTRTVTVPNISCNHCIMTIQRELEAVDGVSRVVGNPSSKTVTATWEEPPLDWESLKNLLNGIGYPPSD